MQRRIAHKLTRNETTDLPQTFCVVDTETKPVTDAIGQIVHRLWFGCAIWFTLPVGPKKKPQRDLIFFETQAEFWTWFSNHLRSHMRVIFSAHNLAFDFLVLNAFGQLPQYGFTCDFPIVTGARFITRAKRDGASVWFIDSMNYIPISLKSLGKSLGLEKMTMPEESDTIATWKEYCQRDTEVLELFWRKLIAFMRDHDLGAFSKTAASMAFNTYRHRHMTYPIFIHNQDASMRLERESYFGGRVECFRIGMMPPESYFLLDVNSMYPYVMQAGEFPTRLRVHGKVPTQARLLQLLNQYVVVATVGINTTEPMYPKRMEGKLIFPVGRFQTTLADAELRQALQHNHIAYIKEFAAYDHAAIFRSYMEEFYLLRQSYKAEGNDAYVLFLKLLCNSLYGKFGQLGHERVELGQNNSILFGHETLLSQTRGHLGDVYYWYGRGVLEKEEGESFNSFPAISACVTSLARVYLWSLIEMAGAVNVFYCDTDSLIVNTLGRDRLSAKIDSNALGSLKLEGESMQLVLRGAKDYIFGDREKHKGVSAKAERINENIYRQIHFATFKESMRHRVSDGAIFSHVTKELTRRYNKGQVDDLGFVTPFRLSEF